MTLPANLRTNWRAPFPALVVGSGAITVLKQAGQWTIGLSQSTLSQLSQSRTTTNVTTATYSASTTDQDILVNFNGAVTITMPPASGRNGVNLIVHDRGGFAAPSQQITMNAIGTDVFDVNGATSFAIAAPFGTCEFKPVQTGAIWTWMVERSSPTVVLRAYNTNTATAGTTLTGANISSAKDQVTLNMTGTLGAGANAQLPTVAALVTAMLAAGIQPYVGMTYELDVMNTSSANFSWTVTTNTGWTLTGTMTIAQNTFRRFYITLSSLTAATLQSVGQYAINAGI